MPAHLSTYAQKVLASVQVLPEEERRTLAEAILATIPAAVSADPTPPPAEVAREITYSDVALTAGRPPAKLFIFAEDGNTVHKFEGNPIARVVVIKSKQYDKNGKWSHTKYSLAVAPGYSPVELRIEIHQDGVFTRCGSFAEAAALLRRCGAPETVEAPQAKAFMETHYPKAHDRIAEIEAQLAFLGQR